VQRKKKLLLLKHLLLKPLLQLQKPLQHLLLTLLLQPLLQKLLQHLLLTLLLQLLTLLHLLLLQHHKLHLSNLLLSEKGELLLSFFIAHIST
jgi:hypothetical protein